jgi:hypothetical protein
MDLERSYSDDQRRLLLQGNAMKIFFSGKELVIPVSIKEATPDDAKNLKCFL